MPEQKLLPSFFIREIPIFGDLILAPMDGVSDYPFRELARQLGSAMSYTEFINAMDVLHKHPKLTERIAFSEFQRPLVFQIFDDNLERIIKAADKLQKFNPDIIDINMGCPQKNVSNRGAGAGLLLSPLKIARIFRSLSKLLKIPITGKIRIGWDEITVNYCLIARIIEENGGQCIAVHGRTKKQMFSGQINLDAIAEIKQKVSIPVIGNGDISTVNEIEIMKKYTRCDAVMIGRAAIGNPWLFQRKDRNEISQEQVWNIMNTHLLSMQEFYGTQVGMLLFRKFAVRYIQPYPATYALKKQLLTSTNAPEFFSILAQIFK